jgi:tetratricopeptide (TPR) repeat protein
MYATCRWIVFTGLFLAALLWPIEISGVAAGKNEDPPWSLSWAEAGGSAQTDKQSDAQDPYNRAVQAMDERLWDKSVELFTEAIRQKSTRTDGALYWKAYSLNKLGQRLEALSALKTLASTYPESKWLRDAKAMEIEMRQSSGQSPIPEEESDEELKLMAINSLMNSNAERAIPLLEKVLQSNQSTKVKERALFVLAQSGSDSAAKILARVAKGNGNPELQSKAIKNLGLFGNKANRELLSEIYSSTADIGIKRTILRSYMTSGDRSHLVSLAETEKVPELRRDAIRQLGLLNAREDLQRLYKTETTMEGKEAILRALFLAGDTESIAQVAKTEKDVPLRRTAIRHLGLSGAGKNSELLMSLYQNEKDPEIQKSAIEGLFLQGNAKGLIELARKESDPEKKKRILSRLSLMRSPEAIAYFTEILDK